MLKMYRMALLLACLSSASHGRRMLAPAELSESRQLQAEGRPALAQSLVQLSQREKKSDGTGGTGDGGNDDNDDDDDDEGKGNTGRKQNESGSKGDTKDDSEAKNEDDEQKDENGGKGKGEDETSQGKTFSRMIIIEHFGQDPNASESIPSIPPPGFPNGIQMGGGGGSAGSAKTTADSDDENGTIPVLMRRLDAAQLPQEAKDVADRELKRLQRMSTSHPEYSKLIEYLEFMADLPWNKSSEDTITILGARQQLEADHFGMERVKARILEHLSVCKVKGDMSGSILCLQGPPGIGKTSLGRSIADALHRDFYRVSLGGVHSESEVRGHRRTYVGAMPGLILQAIKKCGTNNCVIVLDEIDKLGRNSFNGDPSAALLEVLDPEQNSEFRDHFLNFPFNLSKVFFIATSNELEPIPRPLRDRMEVIEMSGYTVEEKIQIALRHLLPKQRGRHGLNESDIQMEASTVDALISGYTREAGVRELDRQLAAICRSVAARTAEAAEAAAAKEEEEEEEEEEEAKEESKSKAKKKAKQKAKANVDEDAEADSGASDTTWTGGLLTAEDLIDLLGPPKYEGPRDNVNRMSKPGIAAGLAYTAVGGDVLFVEAETMAGKGALTITGTLGDVMIESVKIATGWVRAHAKELNIPPGADGSDGGLLLDGTDLHIHFPAGATPKDGPSAGVTIATAIVSLLTGRLVRSDLAMTGEITLRGLVLPVGGIKEKLIAAHRAGMKHILIPAKNEKDLRELPPSVLDDIKVTLVKGIDDVLAAALQPLLEEVVEDHSSAPSGMLTLEIVD